MNARELGLQTASDSSILDAALAEGRIIVTLDSDFHTMLAIHDTHPASRSNSPTGLHDHPLHLRTI